MAAGGACASAGALANASMAAAFASAATASIVWAGSRNTRHPRDSSQARFSSSITPDTSSGADSGSVASVATVCCNSVHRRGALAPPARNAATLPYSPQRATPASASRKTFGCATTCPVTSMGLLVLAKGMAVRKAWAAASGMGGSGSPSDSALSAIMMPTPPETVTMATGATASAGKPPRACQRVGRRPRASV
ncbi:hypothetical protein D3C86_1280800 [compost metagenome]